MANSTGKVARRRYGTRFAAKRRSVKRKQKRTWGKLPYSVLAGNAMSAVSANDALVYRIFEERRRNGWADDANVSVPGPTRRERGAQAWNPEDAE